MEKSRIKKALDAHNVYGFDCCEAIFVTYADILGVPYERARYISHTYGCNTGINGVFDSHDNLHYFRYMYVCSGYGIDQMFGNCGALCGAQFVAAVAKNPIRGEVPAETLEPAPICLEMRRRFLEEVKFETCNDILHLKKADPKFTCDRLICMGAKYVEDMVFPGMFEPVDLDNMDDLEGGYPPIIDNPVEDVYQPQILDLDSSFGEDFDFAEAVGRGHNSTVEMTMNSERLKSMRAPVKEILGKMKEFDESGEYEEGEYYYRGIFLEALRDEDCERLLAGFWGLTICCKKSDQRTRCFDMALHELQKMDDWGYSDISVFATAILNYAFACYVFDNDEEALKEALLAENLFNSSLKTQKYQRIALNYFKGLIFKKAGKADDAEFAFETAAGFLSEISGYDEQLAVIKAEM